MRKSARGQSLATKWYSYSISAREEQRDRLQLVEIFSSHNLRADKKNVSPGDLVALGVTSNNGDDQLSNRVCRPWNDAATRNNTTHMRCVLLYSLLSDFSFLC